MIKTGVPMSIEKISSQMLNALFSCFANLESVVFWVCDANHSRQIYLNKGFETIWGRPREFLYNDHQAWGSTLLPEDLNNLVVPHWDNRNKCYSVNFRIHCPDGQLKHIKSAAQVLVDHNNNPIAVAGVDELIAPEQWHERNNNQLNTSLLTQEFIDLLQTNFSTLTPCQQVSEPSLQNFVLTIDGNRLTVARREMECLNHLLKGMSAKQTAYELHLSTRTVEKYLNNLRKRLKCRTKVELLNKVYQSNISSF